MVRPSCHHPCISTHDVTLIHANWPQKRQEHFASLEAGPPAGFTFSYETWGHCPGITGSREAKSTFHAIAEVVAVVAERHGVLLVDAGIEKPQEWINEEVNQQTVAHLLLMAAHRAAYCGLTIGDLTDFLSSIEPAHANAGRVSDHHPGR